jgi:predicted kinase
MSGVFRWCPAPPDFQLDWQGLDTEFDWIRALAHCPQDSRWHAEGNVWIHTRMVCEALLENNGWRALPQNDREVVFFAALLHDVAKPVCTREENGRITSRGHSIRGEMMAREILWQFGVPFASRESIVNLIRYHQAPFFLVNQTDSQRQLFKISQTVRCSLLAQVAEADARGRICEDQTRLFENIALFGQYAEEQDCWREPRQFANDHSRFLYFRKEDRDPNYEAFDDAGCEVIVMSGLPGSGKDRWIAGHAPDWPVISLDDLRQEMKVKPTENQGPVVARARELAREHLRKKQSFIWNATNISRQLREHILGLCAAYNARTRIVYVEVSPEELFSQNETRERPVPSEVINGLIQRWEPPDLTEAHQIEWVVEQ